MASVSFNYTIPFGTSLRVGYRPQGSSGPYTYITGTYPTYLQSPYTLSGIAPGNYDIELTTVCPNCSGAQFSSPTVIQGTAT